MTSSTTYLVDGMTCGHCVDAVTREVTGVTGVEDVSVDLNEGVVTVSGAGVSEADVRAAIDEAGYDVREG